MASLSRVSEGKNPIKSRLPHKVIGLATLTTIHAIDKEANPELLKVVDQGEKITMLKIPHHAKWEQALVTLPIRRAVINVTFKIT